MEPQNPDIPPMPEGKKHSTENPWLNKKDAEGSIPTGVEVEEEFLKVLKGRLDGGRLNEAGEPPNLYLLFGFASQVSAIPLMPLVPLQGATAAKSPRMPVFPLHHT